tara:strand:- start:792 stop:989 length:198 start_codon:yes stop_codon:yes gene_type:complete
MKVKCIKTVTLRSLNLAFVEGKEYEILAKDATAYSEYFEKIATKKTTAKKADAEENKEATTEENK